MNNKPVAEKREYKVYRIKKDCSSSYFDYQCIGYTLTILVYVWHFIR